MIQRNKKINLQDEKAKRYNKIKISVSIINIIIDITFITILAFSSIARIIVAQIEIYITNPYLQFLLFGLIIGVASSLISFWMEFYSSFIIEHRFALSNQSLFEWIKERLKALAVGLMLGIPVALVFYFLLRITGSEWWIYFSIFIFLLSIVLARIAPILIFPIFYKFKPLDTDDLKEKIYEIINKFNIQIKGIFTFNMSKDTKKANAGFTGIGKSKRIILSDTLIECFSTMEIIVIFAHEVGHYKKKHIIKNILLGGIVLFLSFYLCGNLYEWTIHKYGFINSYDIAAIPILLFYLTLFSLIIMPITNIISRKFERDADLFSIQITEDRESFISSMEKLAEMNLADKAPNKFIEFLFYSHPSIKKRIDFAKGIDDTQFKSS